jgi:hypothetical protein
VLESTLMMSVGLQRTLIFGAALGIRRYRARFCKLVESLGGTPAVPVKRLSLFAGQGGTHVFPFVFMKALRFNRCWFGDAATAAACFH